MNIFTVLPVGQPRVNSGGRRSILRSFRKAWKRHFFAHCCNAFSCWIAHTAGSRNFFLRNNHRLINVYAYAASLKILDSSDAAPYSRMLNNLQYSSSEQSI